MKDQMYRLTSFAQMVNIYNTLLQTESSSNWFSNKNRLCKNQPSYGVIIFTDAQTYKGTLLVEIIIYYFFLRKLNLKDFYLEN